MPALQHWTSYYYLKLHESAHCSMPRLSTGGPFLLAVVRWLAVLAKSGWEYRCTLGLPSCRGSELHSNNPLLEYDS